MDYEKLAAAIKLCGSTPKVDQCPQCPYWASGDMNNCIPRVTSDAATAITDLLARAEAAEARVRELETSFRTEKCENGPECAELGRARKRAEAAEVRCRLAEKCFDDSALHACETQLELEKKARAEAEVRAEKAESEMDAAVSDLETVMAYGNASLGTCQFCKNDQCQYRSGTKLCLPKWRGQKEE